MNKSKILLTFLFTTILILNYSLVFGIDSDEASVFVSWDTPIFYQGDIKPATITFTSNFSQPIEIYYIGLNFDWMASDSFQGQDLSENPITVPSYGSHTFAIMVFSIPTTAFIGEHDYFVGIDGSYGGLEGSLPIGFSWDSQLFTLQIQDSAQKTYSDLNAQVSSKIDQAAELTYDSPEAKDLISQALAAYSASSDYASNNQFSEALSSLNMASNYVDLADDEELIFDQLQQGQNQIILLAGIGIIGVVAIIIVFILVSKRKKTSKKLDPTVETETSL
jgi:hypothetical protein